MQRRQRKNVFQWTQRYFWSRGTVLAILQIYKHQKKFGEMHMAVLKCTSVWRLAITSLKMIVKTQINTLNFSKHKTKFSNRYKNEINNITCTLPLKDSFLAFLAQSVSPCCRLWRLAKARKKRCSLVQQDDEYCCQFQKMKSRYRLQTTV